MIKEDRARIIHGEVLYRNQWMPIAKKAGIEKKRREKIEQGLVEYQGEWMTIEEKLARISPAQVQQPPPQQVIINQTFNQQTYDQRTIDQRTIDKRTVHEHKHVHLDAETLMAYGKAKGLGSPAREAIDGNGHPSLDSKRSKKGRALADKRDKQYLSDRSHTQYLEDRSNEEIVGCVEEVDIEDVTTDNGRSTVDEVDIDTIRNENNNTTRTPPRKPYDKKVDPENISDSDVEEFLW